MREYGSIVLPHTPRIAVAYASGHSKLLRSKPGPLLNVVCVEVSGFRVQVFWVQSFRVQGARVWVDFLM